MIKAHELRIGNWVNDFGKPKQILPGDILYLCGEDDTDFGDMYDPIPLTPEILEKAGFFELKGSKKWWWKTGGVAASDIRKVDRVFMYKDWFAIFFFSSGDCFCNIGSSGFDIKYLHQLQNLYFALAGEELEINL
jgi:hypothetical protein